MSTPTSNSETTQPPFVRRPRRPLIVKVWMALMGLAAAIFTVWLIRTEPSPSRLANQRGVALVRAGKFAEAIPRFDRAVQLAPDNPTFRLNRAIARRLEGSPTNRDQAEQEFADILAADPDNPHAHLNLGLLYTASGRLDAASPHFEAVRRIDPADAGAAESKYADVIETPES